MPVIHSLLDTDFYKFTMGQLVFHRYRDVPVTYSFMNRTKDVPLAELIDEGEFRKELDYVRKLKFSNSDLHYLRGTNEYSERMFKEDYLEFLKTLELPEYRLLRVGDTYQLEFYGSWSTAIYWETFALSIVNELYNRSFLDKMTRFERDTIRAEGIRRVGEKISLLEMFPDSGITFSDFGTRRRFSREWQDYVVQTLAEELPAKQFLGTSNVHLAMKHGLVPMGTSAHEMYMVLSGLMHGSDEEILASHNQVLKDWWSEYGHGLSIALTDTYGTDFFFRDMTAEQARAWKGLRQDSGDPMKFGEKALAFYAKHGIDAKEKLLVFSDGLEIDTILKIARRFEGGIKTTFGWGTNLTNDLGIQPISLVVKATEACGHGTVKLSDNLAKAMGRHEDIERFKRIFGYTETLEEKCRY